MERLTLALAWPRFLDAPLRTAKREALTGYAAPVLDALAEEGIVHDWSHVFWGEDALGTRVLRCTVRAPDAEQARERLRTAYEADGLTEGEGFRVAVPADLDRAEGFWGEHLDTWLTAGAALSTLAVAAVRDELGEGLGWHAGQNRPGHVWANQLGLTYMDEGAVYQRLARGYLDHAAAGTSGDQRAAFERVRERMTAALESLPAPDLADEDPDVNPPG
jgi:hypothetical protein